jgi:pimeloyl-ACP methyl ester carboxylesterase
VLRWDRLSSLRLRYRHPNVLPACVLDIMAGVADLTPCRAQPVVLVGHAFGGTVVMSAGAVHEHVAGVVA